MKYFSFISTCDYRQLFSVCLCVTLLLALMSERLAGQNIGRNDSLRQVLKKATDDEEKVKIYNQLAYEYIPTDSAAVMANANEAIALSDAADYPEGKVNAWYYIGTAYRIRGYRQEAKTWYVKSRDLSSATGLELGYAKAITSLGTIHSIEGETEEAMALFKEAEVIYEKEGYREGSAMIYTEYGIAARTNGDFDRALEYYNRALSINQELDKTSAVLKNYSNLANVYTSLGDFVQAVDYHLKSIDLAISLNDKNSEAVGYSNVGQVFTQQYDFEQALQYFDKAMKLSEETGNQQEIAVLKVKIGTAYVFTNRKAEALELFEESAALARKLGSKRLEANALHSLGDAYYRSDDFDNAIKYLNMTRTLYDELGQNVTLSQLLIVIGDLYRRAGNFVEAKKNLEQGVKIAQEANFAPGKRDGLQLIAYVEYSSGNYQAAFEAHVDYKTYFDSLRSDQVTKNIARLEAKFEFKQEKDSITFAQEKANLAYEEKLQRSKLVNQGAIGGGALVLVILGLLYRSYLIKQRSNKELHHKNELIGLKNEELVSKNQEISGLRETEKKLAEETLALKERELTTITMLSHEKNSLLEQLGTQIGQLTNKVDEDVIPDLKEIKRTIRTNLSQESWSMFMYQFEKVHPSFFTMLKERFPVITQHDLRLCAYLKVGMDNKEIARVSNITTEGVKKSINRLKKKIELRPEDDLRDFLIKM